MSFSFTVQKGTKFFQGMLTLSEDAVFEVENAENEVDAAGILSAHPNFPDIAPSLRYEKEVAGETYICWFGRYGQEAMSLKPKEETADKTKKVKK